MMTKSTRNSATLACATIAAATICPAVLGAGTKQSPETPKTPDGWVSVDQDVWELVPDTTGRHLHEAWQAFVGDRLKDAASEIRKAAAVVLFDSRCETNVGTKESLMGVVLDLERLAMNADLGVAFPRTTLDHTFARAECALAHHDILAARKAWQDRQRNMPRIGWGLDGAATHLDGGFLWAGEDMERDAVDAVARAMSTAVALEEGNSRDGKQIQAALEGIEKEVKALDRVVDSFPRVTVGDAGARETVPLPAPDGYVLTEDDVWFANLNEPGQLLHKARADYTNTNYRMAAADLREALVYLRIEAQRTGEPEVRDDLFSSADALQTLAEDVARGDYIPSSRFSDLFTRVHYDLARAGKQAAMTAWAAKKIGPAREALHAALTNLKQGFLWSGHEMQASALQLSNGVESLCAMMAEAVGWKDKEIDKAIRFVGLEIHQLGKEVSVENGTAGRTAA